MRPRLHHMAGVVGVLVLGTAGCGGSSSPGPSQPPAVANVEPLAIQVVQVQKKAITWTVEQPGTIQPYESTPIVAKLPGYVRKVLVDIGDSVKGPEFDGQGKLIKPGQLLAELEIPELEQEAIQKAAAVEQASAEADLARRQAEVSKEHAASIDAHWSRHVPGSAGRNPMLIAGYRK